MKELRGLRPSKPLRKSMTVGAASLPTAATPSASSNSNGQADKPDSCESTPRPARIVSVAVRGGTITEDELLSLQSMDYGVDSVLWKP